MKRSSLSSARRRLLDLMQEMYFGRIEGLAVRNGEPVFAPEPVVIRQIRLGGENAAPDRFRKTDYDLKSQAEDLFTRLRQIGDGVLVSLDVRHGLPFQMEVRQ